MRERTSGLGSFCTNSAVIEAVDRRDWSRVNLASVVAATTKPYIHRVTWHASGLLDVTVTPCDLLVLCTCSLCKLQRRLT